MRFDWEFVGHDWTTVDYCGPSVKNYFSDVGTTSGFVSGNLGIGTPAG